MRRFSRVFIKMASRTDRVINVLAQHPCARLLRRRCDEILGKPVLKTVRGAGLETRVFEPAPELAYDTGPQVKDRHLTECLLPASKRIITKFPRTSLSGRVLSHAMGVCNSKLARLRSAARDPLRPVVPPCSSGRCPSHNGHARPSTGGIS